MAVNFFSCLNFESFQNIVTQSLNDLLCLHVNIRSIRKYWDQFGILVNSLGNVFDAYVLTEINISAEVTQQFSMPGYKSYFFTRSTGRGGGIALFVKDKWVVAPLEFSFVHAESLALNISSQSFSVILWAFYRPPSGSVSSFLDELSAALSKISSTEQLCLVGDFNIDTSSPSRSTVCEYLTLLARFGIEHATQSPTREEYLDGKLVSSCIDHFNVRAPDTRVTSAVITQKLADHYFIACQLSSLESSSPDIKDIRRISVLDRSKFDALVSVHDWNSFPYSDSASDNYTEFVRLFRSFKYASKKTIILKKRRTNQLWLNCAILAAIK